MRRELIETISGIGFLRLSERRRKILAWFFGISLAVHVVGLAVFGGWILIRAQREQETVFVAPPPIKTYEPRKLEHRVKVQKKQRSSSRPSMVPRLVSNKISNLALPEIKLDPKVINTSFQPKFKAVTGTGLGVGTGTGYGIGGFGTGVSAFNFFGIRGRGDKIAVLVDVSVSMVEEERGGPQGFVRVKNRIGEVIDALDEGAMFNVIAFADAAKSWQREMVVATQDHKNEAKRFLQPFNTEGNWGLDSGNVYGSHLGVPAVGGTTRLDLALTAAFQQNADTILIISDGLPRVKKGHSAEQIAAHNRKVEEWSRHNQQALAAWRRSEANARYEEKKVWVPGRKAVAASKGPPKEGQKPQRARPATEGRWVVRRVRVDKGRPRPQPPGLPDPGFWTLNDFIEHFGILYSELYEKKGKKQPVIHTIGYQIDRDGGKFLRRFSSHYKGHYRRVAKIR